MLSSKRGVEDGEPMVTLPLPACCVLLKWGVLDGEPTVWAWGTLLPACRVLSSTRRVVDSEPLLSSTLGAVDDKQRQGSVDPSRMPFPSSPAMNCTKSCATVASLAETFLTLETVFFYGADLVLAAAVSADLDPVIESTCLHADVVLMAAGGDTTPSSAHVNGLAP